MITPESNPQTAVTSDVATQTAIANEMEQLDEMNCPDEIEAVIAGMAIDQKVMAGQSEAGHVWKFKYGSVEVFVQLTGETDDDTLSVWSYVLQLPAKNEPQLMRKLLEMNWLRTFEAHFAIVDDRIVVLTSRTVAGLSPGEISRAITLVATIADDHDEALQAEFGN